jgi:hypothetical protein
MVSTRGLRRGIFLPLLAIGLLCVPARGMLRVARPAPVLDPGVSQAAILAANSVHIKSGAAVTGNIVVNAASPGPTLVAGFEVAIDKPATITGSVSGDGVSLAKQVSISGSVRYNQLSNSGASVAGGLFTPLSLPVFGALPPFQESNARPGAANVFVNPGQTLVLPAGEYGTVQVAQLGVLQFGGGVYDIGSLLAATTSNVTCNYPCRVFRFAGPSTVRIAGSLDTGRAAFFGPAAEVTAAQILVYVGGANGGAGGPAATPPSAWVGRESVVGANLYAPQGTVQIDRDSTVSGALFGRDVRIDSNSSLVLASAFANLPPIAQPASGFTSGTASLTLPLAAFDPEGEDLTFSILVNPSHGSLGSVIQAPPPFPGNPPGCNPVNLPGCIPPDPPRTSATVVYTPFGPIDPDDPPVQDSFVFAATDPHGASGSAIVRINPHNESPPPPPPADAIIATDAVAETGVDVPVEIHLSADSPKDVAVTFTILSGPGNGSLGTLVPGGETPVRSATVLYTPQAGFEGFDSFVFEACGMLGSELTCDPGTVSVAVQGQLAEDQLVDTTTDTEVSVQLDGGSQDGGSVRSVHAQAAFLDGAEMAGNVADANDDGFGDEHNALPGDAPVLVSAGVGQSGGAGSNGTVRIHIEWDISTLGGLASSLQSAQVLLRTNRGTIDSLDTAFYASANGDAAAGDGQLSADDFEAPLTPVAGAVMPVSGDENVDGTFSFDVKSQLVAALEAGRRFFIVQGRVDESLVGPARGLQVYSTASSNVGSGYEPQLSIATPGVSPPPLSYSIESLPINGVLRTSAGGSLIDSAPFLLGGTLVFYTPNTGFDGSDTFTFKVEDLFFHSATATVFVTVHAPDDPCTRDGREPGCLP